MSRKCTKIYTHKYLRRMHRREVLKSLTERTILKLQNENNGHCAFDEQDLSSSNDDNSDVLNRPCSSADESYQIDMIFDRDSQHTARVAKEVPQNENETFINGLRKIAYTNNASQVTIQQIMNLIRPKYPFLPQSARTLLGTPRTRKNILLDTGKMVYFGLEAGIARKLHFESNNAPQEVINISIDCNIDGLPIFKSSRSQFWPILARSTSLEDQSPFAVAIFYGTEKPQPLDLFLKDFTDELEILQTEGFIYNNQRYRVKLRCFSCDAPARSMLKSISSHTSFHGCERCKHKAIRRDHNIFYPITEKKYGRRKDQDFQSGKSSKHIKETKSCLVKLIGLVSQFVLDPMHLIYLGVMKRLIKKCWLAGIRKFRLSKLAVQKLVDELSNKLKDFIPNDFSRKCRGFSEVDRWKATEYRLFLLYTGPVLMREVLSEEQYSHFMLLHAAVFILSNKILISRYLEVARKALSDFVTKAADLYGPTFVVYNVHSLLHICDDVALYGTLEEYSCFPYENFLGHLKRRIRSKKQPLSQICNRLTEENLITGAEIPKTLEYTAKGIKYTANDCDSFQCKTLIARDFIISTEQPDNIVVVHRQICSIKTINFIAGEYKFIGIPFMYVQNLYEEPIPSSKLGIYFVRGSRNPITFSITDISHKCICLPYRNGYSVFPLLHQKK